MKVPNTDFHLTLSSCIPFLFQGQNESLLRPGGLYIVFCLQMWLLEPLKASGGCVAVKLICSCKTHWQYQIHFAGFCSWNHKGLWTPFQPSGARLALLKHDMALDYILAKEGGSCVFELNRRCLLYFYLYCHHCPESIWRLENDAINLVLLRAQEHLQQLTSDQTQMPLLSDISSVDSDEKDISDKMVDK